MTGYAHLQLAAQAMLLTGGSGVRISVMSCHWVCFQLQQIQHFWQVQQSTPAAPVSLPAGRSPLCAHQRIARACALDLHGCGLQNCHAACCHV